MAPSGLTCGETCSVPYTEGTTVYLKATPAESSQFVGWQTNNASVTGKLEMTNDTTITAVFEVIPPPAEEPGNPQPQPNEPPQP